MKRCLIALIVVLSAQTAFAQSGTLRPRFGSRVASGEPLPAQAPSVLIHTPSSSPTWDVSTSALTVAGTCVDDTTCSAVTFVATGATPASGSATLSGSGTLINWTFNLALPCSSGAGTATTITVTGSDGTLTGNDALLVTCIVPDGGPPTVAITSSSSDVVVASYTLTGTCADDVQCSRVQVECATCIPADDDAELTGNGASFSKTLTLALGTNTIDVTAYDAADNTDTDQITVRYDPPLTIGTTSLPNCTVDVACSLPALQTSGGTGAVTFARTGGSAFPDNFSIVSGTGVISGTCSGTSATTFEITATDSESPTPETDTQNLTLNCVAAGSETSHSYFEYQTSQRSACGGADGATGTNCVIQITGPRGACTGNNGGCSLRTQAQLYALGVENQTAISDISVLLGRRTWNYVYSVDPYADKQDAAKMLLSGQSWADCPGAPKGDGCADPIAGERITMKFGTGSPRISTGSLTIAIDYWVGNEWKQNAVSLAEAACGGAIGNMERWKHMRVNGTGGLYWWPSKINFGDSGRDAWFQTSGTDTTGFFNCSDNVVGMISSGATGGGETNATTDSLITPASIGVGDPDNDIEPGGYGTAAYHDKYQAYPLKAGKWTRLIGHIEFRVPANDPRLAPWRNGCDPQSQSSYRIETSSVAASTVLSTGTIAHNIQAGNTVLIWGHENSTPNINGYYTVSSVTATTITIPVEVTTGGTDGVIVKVGTTAAAALCANLLATAGAADADCGVESQSGCTSFWNLFYVWIMDEDRAPQRITYAAPWHTMKQTTLHELIDWYVHMDSSSRGRNGGDLVIYHRNAFAIRNITAADIDDDGCSGRSCGDTGSVNSNLLRKPVR